MPIDFTPVLKVLALLLVIPVLPLLHGWLLGQAWRYMFPVDEANTSLHLAWRVSAGLMVLAVPALVLWISGAVSNLAVILGAITIVVVATGVVVGVRTARHREFTDAFTRKLAVVTGFLSLVVPAGVTITLLNDRSSALETLIWPIITTLVLGFTLYRRTISEYLDRFQAIATRWQVDHLALEILVVLVPIFVPVASFVWFLGFVSNPSAFLFWTLLLFIGSMFLSGGFVLVLPFVGVRALSACVSNYVAWRGHSLTIKKKDSPLELNDASLFEDRAWRGLIVRQTAMWLGSSIAVSVLLLSAQGLWIQ